MASVSVGFHTLSLGLGFNFKTPMKQNIQESVFLAIFALPADPVFAMSLSALPKRAGQVLELVLAVRKLKPTPTLEPPREVQIDKNICWLRHNSTILH